MNNEMKTMADALNRVYTINVTVYGDPVELEGLPVYVVLEDPQTLAQSVIWSGILDENGRWQMQCTLLGYLNAGSPRKVILSGLGENALSAALQEDINSIRARPITFEDMARLEVLHAFKFAYDPPITSLRGLEHAVNLKELHLSQNRVRCLSPLFGLTQLESLELFENLIIDLSPLANLRNLRYLTLTSNLISDIGPLSGLTSLESLMLRANPELKIYDKKTVYLWDNGWVWDDDGNPVIDYIRPASPAMEIIRQLQSLGVRVGYDYNEPD